MAKISIIKSDSVCTVDGYGVTVNVSALASNIWAVQFDSSANTGHIEYTDKDTETISSLTSDMQSIVNANTAAKTAADKKTSDAAAAKAAIEATYGWKRQNEYPDIGDQLDSLYHAGVFDSTMTATIKAVKDKYPK